MSGGPFVVSLCGKGLYVSAIVGGADATLLVDTGAQVSVVPRHFWESATRGVGQLDPYIGRVVVANGEELKILGKWHTVCQFEALALGVEFLVVDTDMRDSLLGIDFLLKYGAIIDLKGRCCQVMGKKVPLVTQGISDRPQVVMLSADVMVPPRSEIIIPGTVKMTTDSPVVGMVEPAASLAGQCDVLVARVVCRADRGVVPIGVINGEECKLYRGVKVGSLVTDIEVGRAATHGQKKGPGQQWTGAELFCQLGLDRKSLSAGEEEAARGMLYQHAAVFSTGEGDLGRTQLATHVIDTGDARPLKVSSRRVPLQLQGEIEGCLKQMLEAEVIQPSCSPWAAPIVPVRKKDGGLRFCVDYRKLNEVTRKDAYPLPRIDDALDSLANASWFSTLDLVSGYWQVEIDPKDKPKTTFITRQGLYEFNVLSFGLCNAPSTFQRLMDLVLADLQWSTCLVYLDDIIVFGRSFEEHLQRLDVVLGKLEGANLKVKPAKCNLFAKRVQYLGHVISAEGVRVDPAKVKVVREWPVPQNQTEVRSFVGLASYYLRFIQGFAEMAHPLHQLTEKGRKFSWNPECDQAFLKLKECLVSAPVLVYPDPEKRFVLDTDASDLGIGAVLSQEMEGGERVVAYASRALTKAEREYATTRKELLSMVTFMRYFRHYLLGREFVLRTDHNSLRWLHNFQGVEGQLARWMEQLANFQYIIVHRAGKLHANADAMSRVPAFGGCEVEPQVCALLTITPGLVNVWGDSFELGEAQQGDEVIKLIIRLKQRGLDGRVAATEHEGVRRYLPVWDELEVREGILVRNVVRPHGDEGCQPTQLVVPAGVVPCVLYWLHNTKTGGHLGVQKVHAKVRDRFFWPGWQGDVRRWCRECMECASRKEVGAAPRAPMVSTVSARPYERVALDVLGPLPETGKGNKYILVGADYFSKWTEAKSLPNQEAITVARVLVEEWVCRYGTPRTLHSDQGRNFESRAFQELCRLLDIHKTRTSPYSPQSDGLVERFNRTLLAMLSLFVNQNQSNWDTLLPYVMMAYRSSVHASTGYTLYKVLFAREMVLPIDIMLNLDHGEKFRPVSEYVAGVSQTLETVVEAVRRHQNKASAQQKKGYDFRAQPQWYTENELVWLRDKVRRRGLCPKLQRRFKGPFRVMERILEVLYRICPVHGGGETVIHVNRLKPCVSPSEEIPRSQGVGVQQKEWRRQVGGMKRPREVYSPASWWFLQPRAGPDNGGGAELESTGTMPGTRLQEMPRGPETSAGGMERITPQQLGAVPQRVALQETQTGVAESPQPQQQRPRRDRRLPAWTRDFKMD